MNVLAQKVAMAILAAEHNFYLRKPNFFLIKIFLTPKTIKIK